MFPSTFLKSLISFSSMVFGLILTNVNCVEELEVLANSRLGNDSAMFPQNSSILGTDGTEKMNLTQSKNFMDFISSNQTVSMRQGSCPSLCQDTVSYIQHIQERYRYRSLFEMYYFISVSPGCYCHDYEFEEEGPASTGNSVLDFLVDFGSMENEGFGDESSSHCGWRNVIFWLIRLIHCRVHDLRHLHPREVCFQAFDCIC